MKAAQINEYGDASVVKVVDIEVPKPQAGQVLVEVHASSINPFDISVRSGKVQNMIPSLPITLGGDIAGIITELGEGVTELAVGDRVYGQANVVAGNSGAFAEYAVTKVTQVGLAPKSLDDIQAGALPLVGLSALQALTQHLNLQSGQKIFIHGGAGGIGSHAIQLAKHIGAYVATTATGEDIAHVKSLGADEVIDYKAQDFSATLKDFDAVFDTVGGEEFNKALPILKRGGVAVSMTGHADEGRTRELGVTALTQSTHTTPEMLNKLRELVDAGIIKPQIGKIFPLDQIQEAFRALETHAVHGKVAIKIK